MVDKTSTFVAMKDTSNTIPLVKKSEIGKLSAASAKTNTTFSHKGSDRQCVMEVLALAEVLKLLNPDIKVVVLLKICRVRFQIYVYFTGFDLLIRTAEVPFHDPPQAPSSNSMMAYFIYFMILNQYLNTSLPSMLQSVVAMQCGWLEAYNSCGHKYLPVFCPQKPPPKSLKIRVTGPPSQKRLRKDRTFPTIDF